MREVYIISRFHGKVNRGVETYVGELAKRLPATIIASPWPVLFKPSGSIVISNNGRWDSILVRLITWLKGQKLIIPGQSGLGFDDRLNLYCFPDVFVSLTTAQNSWAQKINPYVKKAIIPNGVDLHKFTPAKFKPKKPIVGYVAALYPEKRQELLIRAVAKTNANLLLIGDGPDKNRLTFLCQQLLPNRFEIKSVPHDLVSDICHLMSVFCYPTVPWESFGIAMLEAMACNLPVVATDDPIRREIVGEAGLFATPENLFSQIQKALSIKWGNKPRQQAEKYSWDKIAIQYQDLIKAL